MRRPPVLLCLVTTFVLIQDQDKLVAARPADTKYTTKYDNVDVDSILASTRLLTNYVHCVLDKGPCTADGKELKKYIPDALATECSKCSAVQKKQTGKVLSILLHKYRDTYWKDLIQKYDPDGNFQKKYAVNDIAEEVEDYSDLEEA